MRYETGPQGGAPNFKPDQKPTKQASIGRLNRLVSDTVRRHEDFVAEMSEIRRELGMIIYAPHDKPTISDRPSKEGLIEKRELTVSAKKRKLDSLGQRLAAVANTDIPYTAREKTFSESSVGFQEKLETWGLKRQEKPKPPVKKLDLPPYNPPQPKHAYSLSADDMMLAQLRGFAQSNILWQHYNVGPIISSAIKLGWDAGYFRAPLNGRAIDEAYRKKTGRYPYYPPR